MATQDTLRDNLLRQDSIASGTSSAFADEILAKERAQVRRLRLVAWISGIVFATCLGTAAGIAVIVRPSQDYFVPAAVITLQALLMISGFLTVSLYVRSRRLTMHQIQARLASIEAQLKEMNQKH